jgi:NB-ARC domain/WD domain, G-beta repeat/APAF-1 helical domain
VTFDVAGLASRVRGLGRWPVAVIAFLGVFALWWWGWEAFRLPPAGADRLGVALASAAAVSGALSGPLFFWAGQAPGRGAARVSFVPTVAGWVGRAELAEVVSALTAAGSGAVALTTGLVGAGGFGKTTLAAMACQDRRVRRRFRGGIVWLTVGRDTDGPGLAERIGEVIAASGGDGGAAFTSPEQAGRALGGALSGRGRTLLVADDVWTAAQLEPFAAAGQPWRLLVTTRRPVVLDDVVARRIKVDAMPDPVARLLLARNLPVMDAERERELLELTGRWPLLLNLVNHRLADEVSRGAGIDAAAAAAAWRLREAGPAVFDIRDSGQRQTAVAATVGYSLEALDRWDRDRFFELGVFAEDAEIPVAAVELLWQGTGGLGAAESASLCERLDGLSLLALAWSGQTQVLVLHDVIRDFALSRLGTAGTTAAHAALVGAARGVLPAGEQGVPAWWRLPDTPGFGYLWTYVTYHLKAAGLAGELDQVCCDLRFISVRLLRSGPAAVEADLARSDSPAAARLRTAIGQNAHLLGPAEPEGALITTLSSRLGGFPELAAQLPALRSGLRTWTAWPSWLPPDQPSDALIRVLTGHTDPVNAVAISPNGTWLATGSNDKTVRTWNADGTPRATLTSHDGGVNAVAISPDGTWLATAGRTIRTWKTDGSSASATAIRADGILSGCAWSPGSTDLCIAGQRGLYRFTLLPPTD